MRLTISTHSSDLGETINSLSKGSTSKSKRDSYSFCYRLKDETHYSEEQIKNLKNLYVNYAEIGRGMSITSFRRFMTAIFNIEGHPFAEDFFLLFDSNRDGLVDFYEMVIGMN